MPTTATTATTVAAEPPRRPAPSEPIIVRPITGGPERLAWAQYVELHPAGRLFHHPLWSQVVERIYPHQPLHLGAWRGDRLCGVLPLHEVRSLLAGRLLVSVPYGAQAGVLGDDPCAAAALGRAALELVRRHRARSLELRSESPLVDGLPRDERYVAFVRDLPAEVAELDNFLPRKARAAVRQAIERERLTVSHDPAHLPIVWKLYARSMRRLGSVNHPLAFFRALRDVLDPGVWVTTVWRRSRAVGGLISLVYGDRVMPYFVGTDERLRCTGAMNLLYFAVMRRAVEAGLRRFDFGRSRRANRGPCEFKRNQGFEPKTLGYQRYVPAGTADPDLTPANPRYALARRVWRRLPLAVTARLGALLSRSIPG